MTREDAVRRLVAKGYSEREAESIVTTLEWNVRDTTLEELVPLVPPRGADPWEPALQAIQAAAAASNERQASAEHAVSRGDRDGDGEASLEERAAEQARQQAVAALSDGDPSNDAQALEVARAAIGQGTPEHVVEFFGGRPPEPWEIEEAIDAYNELNPARPVETPEQLWARLAAGEAAALQAVEAVAPNRPTDWQELNIGGRVVRVRGDHYQAMRAWGDGFLRTQNVIFGSDLPPSAVIGALAVANVFQPRPDNTGRAESLAEAYVVVNAYLMAKQNGTLSARRFLRLSDDPETAAKQIMGAYGDDEGFQEALQEVQSKEQAMIGFRRAAEAETSGGQVRGQASRALGVRRRYEDYYRQYNNHGLALVALRDPKLAEQIFENPQQALRDPKIANFVEQIFLDAGYDEATWRAQGDAWDGGAWAGLGVGGGGRQGPRVEVVNLPDDAALEESMRNLWRAWFRRDPTAEEMAGFVGHIDGLFMAEHARVQAEVGGGGGFNPFKPEDAPGSGTVLVPSRLPDAGAELLQRARESEDYRRLFGRKPAYMDEDEYVQRFERSARSFAGNTITVDDAVAAGMESGDTNTTIGRLFMNPEVFDNSSTFRERMFRAAQVFRRVVG